MDYIHIFSSCSVPRNRSVLVWGFGNAAHETAREMQKFTQDRWSIGCHLCGSMDWFKGKITVKTLIFNGKIDGFRLRCSLKNQSID